MENMSGVTRLGEYFESRSISKARVGKKIGVSKNRMTAITTSQRARLTAEELYLIALAIEVKPGDLLEYVCGHLSIDDRQA